MNKSLVPTRLGAAAILVTFLTALRANADTILRVSQFASSYPPSATAGGSSGAAVISPDGRYVVFGSTVKNLAVTSSNTAYSAQFWPCFNVYLHDRTAGTTTLVSINAAGTGGANADSVPKGISTNGQYVLFESFAGNLVTNQTSGKGDIYVRDVVNGVTLLASVNTNGAGGNAVSQDSVMTPDGRYVAFSSLASDLVRGDTNGIFDVFVRDTVAATTTLVSTGAINAAASGSVSKIPSVTPDGRYVLFYSTAGNLVPGAPAVGDLYVRDTVSNTTAWVSVGAQGLFQAFSPDSTNAISFNGAISDDGSYVAYEACSVAYPDPAYGYILRYNLQTGTTDIVSTNAYVQPLLVPENMATLDMTPDGRYVAYVGNAGSVGNGLPNFYTNAVFRWDATSGSNVLASVNMANGITPGAESDLPAISTNGQYVTFVSSDTNLTTNTLNGVYHLYRRDLLGAVTVLVDADTNGAGAGVLPDTAAVISADGSLVAYQSDNGNIATNDRNRDFELFIRNFSAQATELVSARSSDLPSLSPDGLSGLSVYSVNVNGRYVAFASDADDITGNDTNGLWDVFVSDLLFGTNTLVSVTPGGFSANGPSFEPSITGDGRYVAFSSYATNLVAGDTNGSQNVYLRDLQAGTTTLVSVGQDGVSFGSSNSWQPTISMDGRYVLFHSYAQNLSSGTIGSGLENIFLCDVQSNITYPLVAVSTSPSLFTAAMTPNGEYVALAGKRTASASTYVYVWNTQTASMIYTNLTASNANVSISAGGQKTAWWNTSLNVVDLASQSNRTVATGNFGLNGGMQFSANGTLLAYAMAAANTQYAYNVYVYNFQTGSNLLVSHAYNSPTTVAESSDSPAISPDGRFIVYRSSATNLVAGVTNGMYNLFIYDGTTGVNSLLTQNNLQGVASDSISRTPVFTGNGGAVIFQSWSSDLTSFGDYNNGADLFSYAFPYLQITPRVSALRGPVLNWAATPGQTYQVQYLDALSAPAWQNLPGTPAIQGNRASLTNAPPLPGQRFYRLVIQ